MIRGRVSTQGERGQMGIIGGILVIALVFTLALFVLYGGSSAITEVQQDRADEQSKLVMENVDAEMTTLTRGDDSKVGSLSMAQLENNDAKVVRSGSLNVTVNEDGDCRTDIPLSSVRYQNNEGRTVAYEAGGVWVGHVHENGSAMQTPPSVRFRNGSVDVEVTNLTGEVSNARNQAFYNATSSEQESTERSATVVSGDCNRPDNVTINVTSDFADGWESHLREEFGADRPGIEVRRDGRNVSVFVAQNQLPRRADDERNAVIDFGGAPYMDTVEIDKNTIRVSKGLGREYSAFVEPLAKGQMNIGETREIAQASEAGTQRDIVFVVDESGSMSGGVAGDADNRTEAVWEASQNFAGSLNESRNRVGLVGYSDIYGNPDFTTPGASAWIYEFNANGERFTSDFDAFNDTVEDTEPRSGTNGATGVKWANTLMHTHSDPTRERVVVFLTDGKLNRDTHEDSPGAKDAARDRAETADSMGTTIYTVGFGSDESDVDDGVLQDMADETGGEYYFAEDQDELDAVFQDIEEDTQSREQIARTPTTTNVSTAAGDVLTPDIPGDTSDIESAVENGNQFLNVNDPTAPSGFSHSFRLADDETIQFNTSTYQCDAWRGTDIFRSDGGKAYQVVRCTDFSDKDTEVQPDDITVYTDGDDISSELSSDETTFWQENLEGSIKSNPNVELDGSNQLVVPSNQALVVMDYPDGANTANKQAMLYRLGISESEASPEDILNIRVNNVSVES